ncbi:hypothetical protein ABMA27_015754 [Loxostege sticticalis]|uniref:Carboxylic ester hydrolase n=1 Tax=Loxostege sticticalis TaxID=481309 RepID=A0ABR3I482_LOXSC
MKIPVLWRWGLLGLLVVSILLTVFLVIFLRESQDLIIVNTPVGSIQGMRATNGDYNIFLGIPYAKVNESNPFGASTPYPKFDNVFVANDDTKICPQHQNPDGPRGVIDCLHLSISVPDSAASSPLPVMVWIHSGAFERGATNTFGIKYLVRHGVIIVSINYRLGPYGFMCLDIPEVPGNQGLKDQVLALRWVRDNIEAFGGDVNKINVFGLSAGGHSIDFHILSDTEILFNSAIIQSGSSMASTVFNNHRKTAPIDIAAQLGYNTSSIYKAITYLSTVDSNLVITASRTLNYSYKPCTEIKFDGVESFLTRHWINADTPKVKGMPILIGYTEQELLMRYVNPNAFTNFNAIRNRLSETFNFDEVEIAEREETIRKFYFGDNINITYDQMWEAVHFDSDYTYVYPTRRTINKYVASSAESIFFYVFAYYGTRNFHKMSNNVSIGSACHGDDLGYVFELSLFVEEPTPEDQLILDRITTMWTNFAKYSDPTPQVSSLLPVRWPSLTAESYNYMTLTEDMKVGQHPIQERMEFWDIFYEQNKKFEKGFYQNE